MKESHAVDERATSGRTIPIAVLGVFLMLFGVIFFAISGKPNTSVSASAAPQQTPADQKRYKGTKRIVKDNDSGDLRLPTNDEVEKLVSDLTSLTKQDSAGLPETSLPNGGVAVDLQGGFGGTMLARPNADGTVEMRCVFTFEEGAEFLGLVEETF